MENTYLIEIRLGQTKWRIRKIIFEIAEVFPIGECMERHPHVTLFGPLTLKEGTTRQQLLDTIGRVAAGYDPLPFMLDEWEKREGMHGSVLAFKVRPSTALTHCSREISEALSPMVLSQNIWDKTPDSKWFHVTIANGLDSGVVSDIFAQMTAREGGSDLPAPYPGFFKEILHLLAGKTKTELKSAFSPVLLDETGLRITVMEGNTILAEYDLLEKLWITRDTKSDAASWQKSLALYRHYARFELTDPEHPDPEDIYLIADLHLGHANIIQYCSRPFTISDVQEMDHVLIKNWNYTVSPASRVYYLGDLRYSEDAAPDPDYRRKLKGRITFILGNHDNAEHDGVHQEEIEYGGLHFLLVHNPSDAPREFNGWVIHGHHHNNNLREYPFVNFRDRRINVSAEVIGYLPVNLKDICTIIRDHESDPGAAPVLLRYSYVKE